MSVEEFQAPASLVSVDGNVVGDELMDESLWATSLALARKLPPTIQNTFAPNVANCCEDGTVTGWTVLPIGSDVKLSPSTDWKVQGNYSLKVDCPGKVDGEGTYTWPPLPIKENTEYTLRLILHGTVGTQITVNISDGGFKTENGAWRFYTSRSYVLSGENDTITIPYTSMDGAKTLFVEVCHSIVGAASFNVDACINVPGNFPNILIPNVATGTNTLKTYEGFGTWEAAISSVIEQAYKSTNSLKVIPNTAGRGMFIRQIVPIGRGQYSLISVLKGKSGSKISISIEQADELNNQSRGIIFVGELTFDGTWQVIKWTGTLDNATTKVTPTFYVEDANAYFFGAASFHPGNEQKLEPSLVWSEGKGAIISYPSGDTCILCQTPGSVTGEGINEYYFSQYRKTLHALANQKIWHSLYLNGSGTVELFVCEFNLNGLQVRNVHSDPITLSDVWQRVDCDIIASAESFILFSVVTTTAQVAQIRINDVYINVGDSARSGANLAPNDIKGTGADGTTGGFVSLTGNELISVDFDCDAIEATYSP